MTDLAQLPGLMPQYDFKPTGALAGYLLSQQMDLADQIRNRSFQDDDVKKAMDQLKLQNEAETLPVNQADRQNKLSEAALQQSLFTSGAKQQLADSAVKTQLSDDQIKQRVGKIDDAIDLMSRYQIQTPTELAANHSYWKDEFKKRGMSIADDPQSNLASIPGNLEKLAQTRATLAQMPGERMKSEGAVEASRVHGLAAEEVRAPAAVEAAKVHAAAIVPPAEKKGPEDQILLNAQQKTASGQPLQPGEVSQVAAVLKMKVRDNPLVAQEQGQIYTDVSGMQKDRREAVAKQLGLGKDSTAFEITTKIMESRIASKLNDEVKTRLAGAQVVTPNGVVPVEKFLDQGGQGTIEKAVKSGKMPPPPAAPNAGGPRGQAQIQQSLGQLDAQYDGYNGMTPSELVRQWMNANPNKTVNEAISALQAGRRFIPKQSPNAQAEVPGPADFSGGGRTVSGQITGG